jgi:CelD/BcsL family acetyltransferase involved in cellulose biosynthesis
MLAINQGALKLDVVVDVEAEFDFLSDDYRALHNLRHATAFQSPRWLDGIHRDLVPLLDAKQHTITIRNRHDGALIAVLPLVLQKIALLSVIQPADFGVCDANAVVGDPRVLENLVETRSVLDRIDELLDGASLLMFRKVRKDSFDVRRFFRGATASPCENAAYHSETGADFEIWQRKTINRKFSKELGRLGRQLEREFGRYEHRLATSEEDIRGAFAFLTTARKGRFRSDILDNEIYANFYRSFALKGAATGDALTYVSYLNSKPIAVLFGVGCENQCHAVLIGADIENFGKYSVGIQLLYRVIKLRFDVGLHRLDFGLGNTGYKSLFRVEETLLENITMSRSPAGSAMSLIYHHSKPLKDALRRLIPKLR